MSITYAVHSAADIFPMMTPEEFCALKEDIKANGLQEPVWMIEGRILDGRNRFKACQEVGVPIITREYEGNDPVGFVLSLNLARRHLNESQRAMVAARVANMPRGGDRPSKQDSNFDSVNLPIRNQISQQQAADMLNVSEKTVRNAKKVTEQGTPELVEQVQAGNVSVSTAATIAALPKEEQQAIIESSDDKAAAVKEAAKEIKAGNYNHRAIGTGENEWYTPASYVETARDFLGGIDLDPASSDLANETVKANSFYSIENDGLGKNWSGKVWMNPPYSQPDIRLFTEKLVNEYTAGNVNEAIALTHNYTDTAWFHYALTAASAVCFSRGRIGFINPEGKKAAPTQGQAFLYFGSRPKEFCEAFSQHGKTLFNEL